MSFKKGRGGMYVQCIGEWRIEQLPREVLLLPKKVSLVLLGAKDYVVLTLLVATENIAM
jgi:hypothetical protein